MASGRLGVIETSKMVSGYGKVDAKSAPGAAYPSSNTRMPPDSSPRPNSTSEQIIPGDETPRISFSPTTNPPGSTAPTVA